MTASLVPRVSVVMSVYNGAKFLPASVDSILAQSFNDFEFLIVNDGSTDDSGDILQRYAERDSRIRLIQNDRNLGLTRSLNRALPLSRGCFIARHDSDDISKPRRFSVQVEFLEANPSYGILGSSFDTIDESGKVKGHVAVVEADQEIRREILFKNPFCHGSMMFRRSLLEVSLYDEAIVFAQDYALWSRYIRHTKAHNLRASLVSYRVYDNNISSKQKLEQDQSAETTALQNIREASGKTVAKRDLEAMRAIYHCRLDNKHFGGDKRLVGLYLDILHSGPSQSLSRGRIALREVARTWQRFMPPRSRLKAKKWRVFMRHFALCVCWVLK